MDENRSVKKQCIAVITPLIFILFVTMAATVKPAYSEDETIEVTCFKGNLDAGNQVGNITVTNPAEAGQTCNSTFYDCDGKCVGCYDDQNLGKKVCLDSAGGTVAE